MAPDKHGRVFEKLQGRSKQTNTIKRGIIIRKTLEKERCLENKEKPKGIQERSVITGHDLVLQ